MKRALTLPLMLLLLSALIVPAAQAGVGSARLNVAAMWLQGEELELDSGPQGERPSDRDMRISVWHDREEDDPYERGEAMRVYFRTNQDVYVVVYRIDADGYTEVLWPTSRYDDGFSYGGHVYSLPPKGSERRLRASNSKGVEYIEAIASRYPFDLRELGIDFAFDPTEDDNYQYAVAGDPMLAVNDINYAITGLEEDADYIVTDWAHLYVESKVEHARYTCRQCHGADDGYDYHPYVDTCSKVVVYRDYGWHNNWYASFGWYPLYYDPPYYYWDIAFYRPYVNYYYPVYYSWNRWNCYTRPYSMYWWHQSPYYRGNYWVRYQRGGIHSRPLYDYDRRGRVRNPRAVQGPPSSRIADVRSTDRTDQRSIVRGAPPVRVASDRSRSAETIVRADRARSANGVRGPGIRTVDRRSNRSQVSLQPVEGVRGRASTSDRARLQDGKRTGTNRDTGGRRWTRPVVRNVDQGGAKIERREDGKRVIRSTTPRVNQDRGSRDRTSGEGRTITPRNRDTRRGGEVKATPRTSDRKRNGTVKSTPSTRDRKGSGTVKSTPRTSDRKGKATVKKTRKGGGKSGGGQNLRSSTPKVRDRSSVSRQPRTSQPKSRASVKRSSGRKTTAPSVRSSSSPRRTSPSVQRSSGGRKSSPTVRSSKRSSAPKRSSGNVSRGSSSRGGSKAQSSSRSSGSRGSSRRGGGKKG